MLHTIRQAVLPLFMVTIVVLPAWGMDCTLGTVKELKAEGFTNQEITQLCTKAMETKAPEAKHKPAVTTGTNPPAQEDPAAIPPETPPKATAPDQGMTVFQPTHPEETEEHFVLQSADEYLPGTWKVVSTITEVSATAATIRATNRSVELWTISSDNGTLKISAAPASSPTKTKELNIITGQYGNGSFELTLKRNTAEIRYHLAIKGRNQMTGMAEVTDTFMQDMGLEHIPNLVGMSSVLKYEEKVTATRQ